MAQSQVHLTIQDGVAAIVFDRPEAHNAMTWAMYDRLEEICDSLATNESVKVVTMRGNGGKAFIAGTDIQQFSAFSNGDDGVEYEAAIERRVGKIECLPMPTIAIIDGWAIGGGLAIAAACDFRVATPSSAFGVPIARTLGNCLSMANVARIVSGFGAARTKKMLMLAKTIDAEEALACGFVTEMAEAGKLSTVVAQLCERLAAHAPLTMRASKTAIHRLLLDDLAEAEDLIRLCYGSEDFKLGIQAFRDKTRAAWVGR